MDLIKLHEKAREAGIDIEIRCSGSEYSDDVKIIGRTITDDYNDSKYYGRMFPIHELEYLAMKNIDPIELAMNEIIKNLEKTKMDWVVAEAKLQSTISASRGKYMPVYFHLELKDTKDRLGKGERTRELYDKILKLHGYVGGGE